MSRPFLPDLPNLGRMTRDERLQHVRETLDCMAEMIETERNENYLAASGLTYLAVNVGRLAFVVEDMVLQEKAASGDDLKRAHEESLTQNTKPCCLDCNYVMSQLWNTLNDEYFCPKCRKKATADTPRYNQLTGEQRARMIELT